MIEAEIILDSINPTDCRLTTWILTYPRIIHAEIMTHRVFSRNAASCLSGDSLIYTDLPAGIAKKKGRRIYAHKLKDLYRKWNIGDTKGRKCRHRLENIRLRCLNEDSNQFTYTKIVDVTCSGEKEVYEIELDNGYKLKCTKEHRLYTNNGWQTLEKMGLTHQNGVISWNSGYEIWTNGLEITKEFLIEQHRQGKKLYQVAKELNVSPKYLSYISGKFGSIFRYIEDCPNEIELYKNRDWLIEQKKAGLTNGRIAELCKTTENRVKHACKKLKVSGYTGRVLTGNKKRKPWNKGKTYKQKPEIVAKWKEMGMFKRGPDNPSWKGGIATYKSFNAKVTKWLNDNRLEFMENFGYKCVISGRQDKPELHHIDPIWHNRDKAFDKNNIVVLNKTVHREIHRLHLDIAFMEYYEQGGDPTRFFEIHNIKVDPKTIGKPISQVGNTLVGRKVGIKNITYIGKEMTYDIEVEGPYHNFVADGFVVHNSRALPAKKYRGDIEENPFIPERWPVNQSGMQPSGFVEDRDLEKFLSKLWIKARDSLLEFHHDFEIFGVHKQITNRLLEPWSHITVLLSGTEFENFFSLRAEEHAQQEFQDLANLMLEKYNTSEPKSLDVGEWHVPFGDKLCEGLDLQTKLKVCVARAARLSYKTFDGEINIEKDITLHDDLASNGHFSCFEHAAQSLPDNSQSGNFRGWLQYRKTLKGENRSDSRVIKKFFKKKG